MRKRSGAPKANGEDLNDVGLNDGRPERNEVQVIARAAAILRTLEEQPAGLSLGQIAQRVSLARSTVQRIVAALAAEKLVIAASPTGRVRLVRPFCVWRRRSYRFRSDCPAISGPALERARRDRRPRDLPEGPPDLHRPGDRLPAAARGLGSGRDISAVLHGERQGLSGPTRRGRDRGLIGTSYKARTPHTITQLDELLEDIKRDAQVGRGVRPRGAHGRHLRRRRGACATCSATTWPSRYRCRRSASTNGRS